MASKKKSKKKKTTTTEKLTRAKKRTHKPKTAKKFLKKTIARSKAGSIRRVSKKSGTKKTGRKQSPSRSAAFARDSADTTSGKLSGDLQGLSNVEDVDSESVDELVEEGNAFEAGVVSGVEDSAERGTREVRTREVPEDDVPEEYLDNE